MAFYIFLVNDFQEQNNGDFESSIEVELFSEFSGEGSMGVILVYATMSDGNYMDVTYFDNLNIQVFLFAFVIFICIYIA